jgi:hypothetical protein
MLNIIISYSIQSEQLPNVYDISNGVIAGVMTAMLLAIIGIGYKKYKNNKLSLPYFKLKV